MIGETPNIDSIGNEGAIFMTYYAEKSCTAGRNSFFMLITDQPSDLVSRSLRRSWN
jgi:hypothetical protein